MTLLPFTMVVALLVCIGFMAWELIVTRRERDEAQREMTYWFEQAWHERRKRERAELGFPPETPEYLFPPIIDHETVMRRILPRDR